MLEDIVTTKVGQIEADGAWVLGTGPDGLRPKKESIRVLNVVTAQHARSKFLEVDVLAVARDVAMVGQSVESGTWTASCVKRLACRTERLGIDVCPVSLQSLADGAIHSWGTNSRVDRYWGTAEAGTSAPAMVIKAENFILNQKTRRVFSRKRRSVMSDLPLLGIFSNETGKRPVSL